LLTKLVLYFFKSLFWLRIISILFAYFRIFYGRFLPVPADVPRGGLADVPHHGGQRDAQVEQRVNSIPHNG
jgi:hypothetical protein